MSEQLDSVSVRSGDLFNNYLSNALNRGNSYDDAAITATKKMYSIIAPQASLIAMKELFGWTLIVSIIIMILARFIPFHRTLKVKQVKAGDDMV